VAKHPTRKRGAPAWLAFLLSWALAGTAHAGADGGTLDPSFGEDGRVTTNFGPGFDDANGVGIQPDGAIVAAGQAEGAFGLVRYLPDGSLDPAFGDGGKVSTEFTSQADWANDMALQPDGGIVVAGTAGFNRFAVARYLPDGTLDPTFSGDGKVMTDFTLGLREESAEAVAIQPDGRIVAAGFSYKNRFRFAVARYLPDGTLDPTFSGDGRAVATFTAGDLGQAVAVQPNGKIVVGGMGTGGRTALARYLPDGTLDPAFSGDGKLTTTFGPGIASANDLAIQPDGMIVAAGEAGSPYFVISRTAASFSAGGGRVAVARYRPNGKLDASFSGDGKLTTNLTPKGDTARGVLIQPNGKIVAAGAAALGEGEFDSKFGVVRYRPDGKLDRGFGGDGKVITNFSPTYDAGTDVARQADGRLVVSGLAAGNGRRFALARYLP
jgi:uncharacterized delta-60 repeat protein